MADIEPEKVEPGDEQILPPREQRELDALPPRLDREGETFGANSIRAARPL